MSKAKAAEAAKKMSDLQKQAKASQREAAKKAAAEKKIEVDAAKLAKNEVGALVQNKPPEVFLGISIGNMQEILGCENPHF